MSEYPMALRVAAGAVIVAGVALSGALWWSFGALIGIAFFFVFAVICAGLVWKDYDQRERLARAEKARNSAAPATKPFTPRRSSEGETQEGS